VPFTVSDEIDRKFAERIGPPSLKSLIDHFDYMLRVAGPEHVGIGSDFDGIPCTPAGMETAACLPRIAEELVSRGWRMEDLTGLLGGNVLRVLGAVEEHAAKLREV
jgi:membrane dipeptidase